MRKHPDLVLLGKEIARLRKQQGYSQDEFAAYANISRAFYGRIERGERNMSILSFIRIIKTLGVDANSLLSMVTADDVEI